MRIRRVERNAENRMANWVSAGCGVIANELAQAMEKRGQKLYGVVNRTQEKAEAFAEKYGVQKVFASFEEVCADPAVDIIYISTPHNTHIHFLRKALAAGKHVLCEKSITLNSEELEEAVQLAKEHGVVLAEAMTTSDEPGAGDGNGHIVPACQAAQTGHDLF